MHDLEPFFKWRGVYESEHDINSPFYGKEHSEFDFTNQVYNYLIHPQWDDFGSSTLYLKLLFVDYGKKFCVIEFIGEWNDAINNDVMWLKREVVEPLVDKGINKFILIGENVLNFHSSDDCYYEEWFQDIEEGWIAGINFQIHVLNEFHGAGIDYYLNFGGQLDEVGWRTQSPYQLFDIVNGIIERRLTS